MDAIRFKFKRLSEAGSEVGFFSSTGSFDGETLVLGADRVPITAVVRTRPRFNRLLLELAQRGGGVGVAPIAITKGDAGALAALLNRSSSARWAAARQQALAQEGKGGTFRGVACPYCGSTVDCSGHPPTAQVHCPYCDAVGCLNEPRPRGEAQLRRCDQCGMYSNPRPFTSLYFWFAFVVYGYNYSKRYMCHSCMRGEGWKMLACNLPFVLGVPVSVAQLVRAYQAGAFAAPDFPGLDRANALAKKGRAAEAAPIYEAMGRDLPAAAGVHFNRGLAWMKAGDWPAGAEALAAALKDCGNYAPAAEALRVCYRQAGKTAELARLDAEWGSG